jgi:protein-tyrosine phosphatase
MKVVLFLCTGNYYRSRFAEELFNFLAPANCPGWVAASRGIAVDLGSNNVGPIAAQTVKALQQRGVTLNRQFTRMPLQVNLSDLNDADHVVALKYTEHFPLMKSRFHSSLTMNDISRIEYWDVHDVDLMTPELALPLIEERLDDLMTRLRRATADLN